MQEQEGRKKYGNMIVLYDNKCLVTLGPDYWCFLPTWIVFVIVTIMMIKFVFENSNNQWLCLATVLICVGTCAAYLSVALSNPGIVTEEKVLELDDEETLVPEKKRLCKVCNIVIKKGSYHCRSCNVCIEGYDHHCPWTSKCIGKGNLCRFYIFVLMVPIFMVFVFIAFASVMSSSIAQHHIRHINHVQH